MQYACNPNKCNLVMTEFKKKEVIPNLYLYKEIKLATNNFDKKNKLGEGGFGVVYKVSNIKMCYELHLWKCGWCTNMIIF
jgi:serine/threonine protein kinase